MTGTLLLLSEHAADTALFQVVAKNAGLIFRSCASTSEFLNAYAANPNTLVVWDADHPNGRDSKHPYAHKAVKFILMKAVPAHKTFALTNIPINISAEDPKFPFLVKYPQHNIIRRHIETCAVMYGHLFKQFMSTSYMNFLGYVEGTPPMQGMQITESSQRGDIADGIQDFFIKAQVEDRLAAKIAQATDELLMNAIFDAPADADGTHTHHLLSRTAQFKVAQGKTVNLEAFLSNTVCGIAVTDHYGSVNQARVLECLRQNYMTQDYTIRNPNSGAGLGLYNIVQSGVSIILAYVPGVKTKAMVFFPRVKSHKDFKEAFQFTAVVKLQA